MFIAAVSSWYLLRRQHRDIARISLSLALPMAAIALGAVIWSGHESARVVMKVQPMKFAAMEAHWEHDAGLFVADPARLARHRPAGQPVRGDRAEADELAGDAQRRIAARRPRPAGRRRGRIGLALRYRDGDDGGDGWRQLHARTAATRSDWNTLSPGGRVHATALASVPSVPTLFASFRVMVGSALPARRRSRLGAGLPPPGAGRQRAKAAAACSCWCCRAAVARHLRRLDRGRSRPPALGDSTSSSRRPAPPACSPRPRPSPSS